VVTAKHGQSPIDKTLHKAVDGDAIAAMVDGAAPLAGHIEDDVALYWLRDGANAAAAASALSSPTATVNAHAAQVFTAADPRFVAMFGDPASDPHAPDVIVALDKGTIYSLSKKKDAEHGGFADDDAHVALLLSNPSLRGATIDAPVRTKQVAPTILDVLDIDPRLLEAVRREGTEVLPGLDE
jgi:arylsulfatase A-like enzyme